MLSKNQKHMSSECNNIKLVVRNDKSKVVCAMCKQCLITTNHDVCVLKYVNGMNSYENNQHTNVSNSEHPQKHKAKVKKPKKLGSNEILASPRPRKPRFCLRPMRVKSINGNQYVLVIVDDYSCYTLVHFLRSKVEAPENDREDIGKLGDKGDIGFYIGYSANSCAYRVYNRRKRKIMETMNVTFDELLVMAFEQYNSRLELQGMTSGQFSSRLNLTYAPSTITSQKPTERELDLLFEVMYDDYIGGQPSNATRTVIAAPTALTNQNLQTPTASTTTADSASTPTNSSS
ncbi:hypothetical protein Tco_1105895 [Tanacetum coccineum]